MKIMNIFDILRKIGYDIISVTEDGIYKVQFTNERLNDMRKEIEEGKMGFEGDLNGTWDIHVNEVSFNGYGNLYVQFKEVGGDDEGFFFDAYEYRNMDKEYL